MDDTNGFELRISNDKEIFGRDKNFLNHDVYTDILIEIIEKSEAPLTIGIHGKWGSGKTSLMNLVREELQNKFKEKYKIIWFDAWKYDKTNDLRVALINTILKSIANDKSVNDSKFKRKVKNYLDKINWYGFGNTAISAGSLFLPGALAKVAEKIDLSKLFKPKSSKSLELIIEFENRFNEIVKEYLNGKNKSSAPSNKKLIIFIDDLDRCLPDSAIEILEAIKVFLNNNKCIFIIGVDKEIVENAIAKKYNKENEDWSMHYIDKIIQVPFMLSEMNDDLTRKFINKLDSSSLFNKYSDIISYAFDNPRTIKRFLNIVQVQMIIMNKLKKNPEEFGINKLIKCHAFQLRWENFFNYTRDRIEDESHVEFMDIVIEASRQALKDRKEIIDKYSIPDAHLKDLKYLNFLKKEPFLSNSDITFFSELNHTLKTGDTISVTKITEDEAVKAYSKKIETNPGDANSYFDRAFRLMELKEYDKAISDFSNYIAIFPKSREAYLNRGLCQYNLSNFEKSIADFTKAIEADPEYAIAYYSRGLSYDYLRMYDRSIADYTKAIEYNPYYTDAYNNRGLAYDNIGMTKEALKDFDQVISINPHYSLAYFNKGFIFDRLNKNEEAIENFSEAIRIRPDYTDAFINRGLVYSELKQFEEALNDFTKAIELEPNYALAYNNRATVFDSLGRYQEAIDDYTKAIALDPNYSVAYTNRGLAYNKLTLTDKAIQEYSKAIELNPNYTDAYIDRGAAFDKMEMFEEALNDYTKAIEIDPKAYMAYSNRAVIYNKQEKFEDAVRDYSTAIEIDPGNILALLGRGVAYDKLEKNEEAIADYTRIIELDPTYADAFYNRGIVYHRMEMFDNSINDNSSAIKINPQYVNAYVNRGLSYSCKDDFERSLLDYTTALTLESDHELTLNNIRFLLKDIKEDNKTFKKTPEFLQAQNILSNSDLDEKTKEEIFNSIFDLSEK